jgi:phage terminase Nu1 subunit (DNA packaging protein)
MTPRLWTVNGLATELGLDRRSLASRLATTPADSQVQGRPAWLMKNALVALGQPTRAPRSELDQERARLAKEQADGHELKNAALRGGLLPAEEVVAGWQAAIGRARSLMLGIASAAPVTLMMLAKGSAPEDAERAIREDLTRRIDAALTELANTTLDEVEAEESGSDASTSVA